MILERKHIYYLVVILLLFFVGFYCYTVYTSKKIVSEEQKQRFEQQWKSQLGTKEKEIQEKWDKIQKTVS